MENFGKFMAILLGMTLTPIIVGFVFLKLWAWFVVPITELPNLTLFQAVGLTFMLNYLKAKYKKEDESEKFWVKYFSEVIFIVLTSSFALLGGYIISLFI